MQDRSTLDRVAAVMATTFPTVDASAITRDTISSDVDGWDSLSHSLLIMGIENEFGLELPFDEAYELENVGALVDLLERLAHSAAKN